MQSEWSLDEMRQTADALSPGITRYYAQRLLNDSLQLNHLLGSFDPGVERQIVYLIPRVARSARRLTYVSAVAAAFERLPSDDLQDVAAIHNYSLFLCGSLIKNAEGRAVKHSVATKKGLETVASSEYDDVGLQISYRNGQVARPLVPLARRLADKVRSWPLNMCPCTHE